MTTLFAPNPAVPPLGPPVEPALPAVAEHALSNGLRVVAVRRAGVPLVEVRLRVPFAAAGDTAVGAPDFTARATLLGETLFTGTQRHDRHELAVALQRLGGALSAGVDADRLALAGSVLAPALPEFLRLLAEVLDDACYPDDEVLGERARVAHELLIARSQPALLAREAMLHRLYAGHPYGHELPTSEDVLAVDAEALRALHRHRVVPDGSVLVLVGDLDPERALDTVASALGGWSRGERATDVPPLPGFVPGPIVFVNRPGAVQTNIRLGGPAVPRTDPDYAALQIANVVYGGYFSSRLVANIRERRGYTYSPRSGIEHPSAGSRVMIGADVATDVTAPALLEIEYELGRIATLPVEEGELAAARQFAIGSLALSTSTQSGLATSLSAFLAAGVGIEFLAEHPRALAAVTADDVLAVARRHLAPSRLATVLLGDAERAAGPVSALAEVRLEGGPAEAPEPAAASSAPAEP